MTGLFRSEEMCLCQLYLQTESAFNIISELGEIGLTQFRDLSPKVNVYQRKFVTDVRRCEEMERKLHFIKAEMKKNGITPLSLNETSSTPKPREIGELEGTIEKTYQQIREINANTLALRKSYAQCLETNHVLRWTDQFFTEGLVPSESDVIVDPFDDAEPGEGGPARSPSMKNGHSNVPQTELREVRVQNGGIAGIGALSCYCGVVAADKVDNLERILWRTTRGNIFFRWMDIGEMEDPESGEQVQKCAYVMFFPGKVLESKVKKIIEAFHATMHHYPQQAQTRREFSSSVQMQINDMQTVLSRSKEHRDNVLLEASKKYECWLTQVRKAKAVFHTLNLLNLDLTRKTLIAECWIPVGELDKVNEGIERGTAASGSNVASILNRLDTKEIPPTYNKTNKYTGPWQEIIDAYGYGSYREVNPTLFTLITFPFLFAVMYGDAGHGSVITVASSFMCIFEKKITAMKIRDDIFNTFFNGRYVLLSMGLFSIYTGSIYNEIFSKSTNVWGSSWRVPYSNDTLIWYNKLGLDPNSSAYLQYPYPYGFDPIWSMSFNKLNYQNSFKMKISVILGVIQMFFGVILSLVNYTFFRNYLDVFCNFIPQLLFLCCIFVYLCILIFYKWIVFGTAGKEMAVGYYPGSHCAPNLLVGLINMIMLKSRQEGFEGQTCFTNLFYPSQGLVEQILVLVALICIPWMLLIKPLILKHRHGKKEKEELEAGIILTPIIANGENKSKTDDASVREEAVEMEEPVHKRPSIVVVRHEGGGCHGGGGMGHGGHESDEEEFSLGEAFITSAIHTVEYCLGLVSHTASYLRLWALSLAHSELADVLWTMVMRMAFKSSAYTGAIMIYVIFFAFAILTIAILVFMDALSVFLHSLRLHWVEFQSKFYDGQGHGFEPFSFKEILALAEQQDLEAEKDV